MKTDRPHQTRWPNGEMFGHQTMFDAVWSPNIFISTTSLDTYACICIHNLTMGRGRNGLIEIKNYQEQKSGEPQWQRFDGQNYYESKNSLFLPEDFVDAMRRMNPREVANILFSTEL